jgi:hypothetical protein
MMEEHLEDGWLRSPNGKDAIRGTSECHLLFTGQHGQPQKLKSRRNGMTAQTAPAMQPVETSAVAKQGETQTEFERIQHKRAGNVLRGARPPIQRDENCNAR